ncbi:hypothetical protein T310_0178 [Rasamsonia emersonii CBS 393.64]|uniref:Uncharacterized protein n=1 Tax=Rasamsonia emersonii (strain ATCC 16479 / CBS 393.64 / IMI 116815) TaxID=1408163 RepID=A0A0F4Z5K7_RASE3|nr:hypothetical protein T310_0178 [Rasamsonia emersonii CBS 393.64]KKA25792.1 hypothetical protein T310_0178 [Rasamsonia emersonii CBS 393.64]
MVTAADSVTPDASFTSPLLAIDEHCRGYWTGNMRRRAIEELKERILKGGDSLGRVNCRQGRSVAPVHGRHTSQRDEQRRGSEKSNGNQAQEIRIV